MVNSKFQIKLNGAEPLPTSPIFALGDAITPPWSGETKTVVALKMGHIPILIQNLMILANAAQQQAAEEKKGEGGPTLKEGKVAPSVMMVPIGKYVDR